MESFAATKRCKDFNEEQFHRDYKFCSQETNKQFLSAVFIPWSPGSTMRTVTAGSPCSVQGVMSSLYVVAKALRLGHELNAN